MRNKLNLLSFVIVLSLLFSFQETNAQRTIDAPTLETGTQSCKSPSDNTETVIAQLNGGPALPETNQFILELSDPSGSFANPDDITFLDSVVGPNNGTPSPQNIIFEDFEVPTFVNSDNYRLRVRSSEVSSIVSDISDEIAFHYFDTDLRLILNNNDDVFVCDGTSINETISVEVFDRNNNEVDANNFEWEWLRDTGSGPIPIAGATDPSFTITEEGEYFVRVPLGKCQAFFAAFGTGRSNNVDVVLINPGEITISTPAPDFSYCPNEEKILVSSETDRDFSYQWFKDDQLLEGEIDVQIRLPQNNFQGEYRVEVTYSESCVVSSVPVTVNNEGSSITQPLPEQLILLPNQVITLEVLTDAPDGSPFRWIVNTSVQSQGIVSGPSLTFDATFIATYRVEIDALDPCNSMLSSETTIFTPVGFDIQIGTTGEDLCDQDTIQLELLEMLGRTSNGLLIPLTDEQLTFFDFEWYRDGSPLGETSLSLLVDQGDEGSYELRANLRTGEFTNLVSNNLPVNFLSNNIELTVSPEFLPSDGSPVTITAPFNDDYTYEWFRIENGEEVLIEGETGNVISTNQEGQYFVRITSSICTVDSLIANIGQVVGPSAAIPNVVTPNNDNINDNWLLPNELVNEQDVEVTIYDSRGRLDFSGRSYQNNWPSENSASQGLDSTYYYIITKNSTVIRKGSITVMR